MNSAPYFSANPPVDSTLIGPARFTSACSEHHLDARVLGVGRAEDRRALVRLVDRVLLRHHHRRQRLPVVGIDERDLVPGADRVDERLVGRQRDRDRPEQAARRLHAVADALPVGVRHEALERREAADAEHDDVALLARADGEPGQRRGAAPFRFQRVAGEQQRPQVAAAVRINQGHDGVLLAGGRRCGSRRGGRSLASSLPIRT